MTRTLKLFCFALAVVSNAYGATGEELGDISNVFKATQRGDCGRALQNAKQDALGKCLQARYTRCDFVQSATLADNGYGYCTVSAFYKGFDFDPSLAVFKSSYQGDCGRALRDASQTAMSQCVLSGAVGCKVLHSVTTSDNRVDFCQVYALAAGHSQN